MYVRVGSVLLLCLGVWVYVFMSCWEVLRSGILGSGTWVVGLRGPGSIVASKAAGFQFYCKPRLLRV